MNLAVHQVKLWSTVRIPPAHFFFKSFVSKQFHKAIELQIDTDELLAEARNDGVCAVIDVHVNILKTHVHFFRTVGMKSWKIK